MFFPQSFITVKLSEAYPSRLHYWTDYLKPEPASRFQECNNELIIRNWTRSLDPRIRLAGFPFPKIQFIIASRKTSRFETY